MTDRPEATPPPPLLTLTGCHHLSSHVPCSSAQRRIQDDVGKSLGLKIIRIRIIRIANPKLAYPAHQLHSLETIIPSPLCPLALHVPLPT